MSSFLQDLMLLTMMDIYARAAMLEKAEELAAKVSSDPARTYCMMLKTYGNCDKAHEATRLLKDVLDMDHPIIPTTQMLNMVLDAWSKSSMITAVLRAFDVMDLFEQPKCVQNNVFPDVITYGSLLKCIVVGKIPGGGTKAQSVLDDMEKRYQEKMRTANTTTTAAAAITYDDIGNENESDSTGADAEILHAVQPDKIIYSLVMRAWFHDGDSDRALATIRRMEETTGIVPDERMYNDMIQHFVELGTRDGAKKAERIMKVMKTKLKPDFYTYSIICKAWLKCDAEDAADRLWSVYEEMIRDKIYPDKFLYLQFIQSLTATKQRTYVQKADTILQDMEKSRRRFLVPTHFSMVFMAYLDIEDEDSAVDVLTRFVHKFGQSDGPFTAIINQLTKSWINKGELKKATFLVNSMQEFYDTGLLMQGPSKETYESLLAAWELSSDDEKDFVIPQIRSIMAALPSPTDATDAATTTTTTTDPEDESETGGISALQMIRRKAAAAIDARKEQLDATDPTNTTSAAVAVVPTTTSNT
jgi:pentatricopeptide repeat protein